MEIPGYKIIRELGRGGMATVYLAVQQSFERQVALKVMSSALVTDPSFCERFIREAKIIAQVSHPNIVAVFDVGEANGNYYIAMEYHTGGDLKEKIRQGLSTRDAIRITREVALALDYAHSKGFIHRDVKPDNVLFAHDGRAVLTDFGIAKAADSDTQLTQLGTVAGTPKYMSPEQARGQPLDGESDLYSLGIMFYEMLTGSVPFKADDAIALGIMHLKDPLPLLPPELNRFQPLLEKLCAKHPAQRHRSGKELAADLQRLESGEGQAEEHGSEEATVFRAAVQMPESDSLPSRSGWFKKTVGVLLLFGLLGVGGWQAVLYLKAYNLKQRQSLPASTPVSSVPEVEMKPARKVEKGPNLAALYQEAEAALSADRLMSPPGDNAYEKYLQILAVDPDNASAQAGLTRIADRYLALAAEARDQGDVKQALEYVDKAYTADPEHPVVEQVRSKIEAHKAQLKKQLAKAQAEEKKNRQQGKLNTIRDKLRIAGLLKGAQTALEENRRDVAIIKYREVLKIDATNQEARKALIQLGETP